MLIYGIPSALCLGGRRDRAFAQLGVLMRLLGAAGIE